MKVLLRQNAGRVLAATMPELLLLLFAVSQLSAIVDFPRLALEIQSSSWGVRGALALLLVGAGSISLARWVPSVRDSSRSQWFWALPLETRDVGGSFVLLALIRAVPIGLVGLLLGVRAGLGVAVASALLGLLCASSWRWWALLPISAAAVSLEGATLWLGVLGVGAVGRELRRSRRLPGRSTRSRWFARGPYGARVNRDLLALWRLSPQVLPAIGAVAWFGGLIQLLLHPHWDASGVAAGAIVYGTLVGVMPVAVLERVTRALGRSWMPRQEAVSPAVAVLAAWTVAGLPSIAVVSLQLLCGVGGPLGAVRVVSLQACLSMFATWSLIRRSPAQRRHALGPSLFVAVFAGLLCFAMPITGLIVCVSLTFLLFLSAVRSVR